MDTQIAELKSGDLRLLYKIINGNELTLRLSYGFHADGFAGLEVTMETPIHIETQAPERTISRFDNLFQSFPRVSELIESITKNGGIGLYLDCYREAVAFYNIVRNSDIHKEICEEFGYVE